MKEPGVRARPRSTRAESHKERSLLDPSRPDPRQLCPQVQSLSPDRALPARPGRVALTATRLLLNSLVGMKVTNLKLYGLNERRDA